jgi:hypothetical protein
MDILILSLTLVHVQHSCATRSIVPVHGALIEGRGPVVRDF